MPTPGPRYSPAALLPAACAVLLTGCSLASWREDADREVDTILGDGIERVLGDRREWVQQPIALPPEAEPEPQPEPGANEAGSQSAAGATAPDDPQAPDPQSADDQPADHQPGDPGKTPAIAVDTDPAAMAARAGDPVEPEELYDLERALRTAVQQNRDFLARREALYQAGLSLSLTRFNFGPQFNSAVSALWSDRKIGNPQNQGSLSFGGSQILPTGGTLALTSSVNGIWPYGNQNVIDSYSSSINATLTQPLLRGAGYMVSHESLTQAERSLVYSIREFERFRENFSIQIARAYFDLVSQRQLLANEDTRYAGAVFDRRKAEALYQVDRNTQQEVFRARRDEIQAQDQLISARAAYDRALDEFKIQLGLATTAAIDVADAEPPYEPVRLEVDSAVAAARHNRLDLITQRQQVEDAERALQIAENGLLPNLDLSARYGVVGSGTDVNSARPENWSSSIGLEFDLPLQRKAQRNSYRNALISLEQARRGLTLQEDQLDLDIRDALRQLKSTEERVVLQEGQIRQEQAAVTVSEIRYEAGTVDNRDLLEARQALVNAKNALIRLKVDHFLARLSLLRDMGLFFVDDSGMWQ
ncbi:MAG: TolC family protein [Planctomycetes bacterium]|nr:TolC family protein [Planctomycetota bacterium]